MEEWDRETEEEEDMAYEEEEVNYSSFDEWDGSEDTVPVDSETQQSRLWERKRANHDPYLEKLAAYRSMRKHYLLLLGLSLAFFVPFYFDDETCFFFLFPYLASLVVWKKMGSGRKGVLRSAGFFSFVLLGLAFFFIIVNFLIFQIYESEPLSFLSCFLYFSLVFSYSYFLWREMRLANPERPYPGLQLLVDDPRFRPSYREEEAEKTTQVSDFHPREFKMEVFGRALAWATGLLITGFFTLVLGLCLAIMLYRWELYQMDEQDTLVVFQILLAVYMLLAYLGIPFRICGMTNLFRDCPVLENTPQEEKCKTVSLFLTVLFGSLMSFFFFGFFAALGHDILSTQFAFLFSLKYFIIPAAFLSFFIYFFLVFAASKPEGREQRTEDCFPDHFAPKLSSSKIPSATRDFLLKLSLVPLAFGILGSLPFWIIDPNFFGYYMNNFPAFFTAYSSRKLVALSLIWINLLYMVLLAYLFWVVRKVYLSTLMKKEEGSGARVLEWGRMMKRLKLVGHYELLTAFSLFFFMPYFEVYGPVLVLVIIFSLALWAGMYQAQWRMVADSKALPFFLVVVSVFILEWYLVEFVGPLNDMDQQVLVLFLYHLVSPFVLMGLLTREKRQLVSRERAVKRKSLPQAFPSLAPQKPPEIQDMGELEQDFLKASSRSYLLFGDAPSLSSRAREGGNWARELEMRSFLLLSLKGRYLILVLLSLFLFVPFYPNTGLVLIHFGFLLAGLLVWGSIRKTHGPTTWKRPPFRAFLALVLVYTLELLVAGVDTRTSDVADTLCFLLFLILPVYYGLLARDASLARRKLQQELTEPEMS